MSTLYIFTSTYATYLRLHVGIYLQSYIDILYLRFNTGTYLTAKCTRETLKIQICVEIFVNCLLKKLFSFYEKIYFRHYRIKKNSCN